MTIRRHYRPPMTTPARRHRAPLAAMIAALALAVTAIPLAASPAYADSTVKAVYATQKQINARLNTGEQVGTYAKGASVVVHCWLNGQNVKSEGGKWSTRWYRDASGWFVPGVDLSAVPSSVGECGATVPGLSVWKWYEIVPNHATGSRLDISGGRVADGTKVQLYKANASKSQRFRLYDTGGRFFRVESQLGGAQVWNASGRGTANGTQVQTWKWSSYKTHESQWLFHSPSGKLTDVQIRPRHHTNKCLDVSGRGTANGTKVQLWDCGSGTNQRFTLKPVGDIVPPHNYKSPFEPGQKWYVYQGYQSGTHKSGYALDLTTDSSTTSSAGKKVRAIAAGTVYYWQAEYGNLCVNTPDGRSYTLTHIETGKRAGNTLKAGEVVGTIAAAGKARNNNVAHLHLSVWKAKNCYAAAGGPANELPFDTGSKARLCGFNNFTRTGPTSGNGIWSGTAGTVTGGC